MQMQVVLSEGQEGYGDSGRGGVGCLLVKGVWIVGGGVRNIAFSFVCIQRPPALVSRHRPKVAN